MERVKKGGVLERGCINGARWRGGALKGGAERGCVNGGHWKWGALKGGAERRCINGGIGIGVC